MPSSKPRYLLLYRTGFAPTNGSSVQVSRLIRGREKDIVHVLWDSDEAGCETTCSLAILADSKSQYVNGVPFKKLSRWASILERFGLAKAKRSARLTKDLRRFETAIVVCMQESDAQVILDVLNEVDVPRFVLHVMDILHDCNSAESTPAFVELLNKADHVFGISKPIIEEVSKHAVCDISELLFSSDFMTSPLSHVNPDLRVAMIGTVWDYEQNRILDLLTDAWPLILKNHPGAEIHYAGLSYDKIPRQLQHFIRNHGHLSTSQCESLLQSCHVAILPVSHPMNHVSRYSLPSRIADYLACGLPTIVSAEQGTATHCFFERVPRMAGINVQTTSELVNAINRYFPHPNGWKEYSLAASKFAEARLSVPVIQNQFWQVVSSLG